MDLAEKEFRVVWKLTVEKGWIPIRRKSERELWIQFENGSFIECRSEENPDQLIGEGLDLVVLAEAARLKQRTWDQYIRPALADRQGRAIFTSTPRGFNYFYEFYNRGQNPEKYPGWESWQIPSLMNPLLPVEEILEAQRTSSPEAFAQEWEAKFIAYAGLVFPEFSTETHVRALEFNPLLPTALAVDPGGSSPYAVLLIQWTPEEEVFILDEIYSTGRVSDQIVDLAAEKWPDFVLNDHGNPREEVIVIVDAAAHEAAATWRLRGFRTIDYLKPKIKQGLEVHHKFLRDPYRSRFAGTFGPDDPGEVVPRIFFDPKCVATIREHGSYHYPDDTRKRIETNKTELPVDVDNHTIDALRYFYYVIFPTLFNEVAPSITMETMDIESFGGVKLLRMEDSYSNGSMSLSDPEPQLAGLSSRGIDRRMSLGGD